MKYERFRFLNYIFDAETQVLTLTYGYDDELTFSERFRFDFTPVSYDAAALDAALQQLFFVAGVSYYKAFLAPNISVECGEIDTLLKDVLNRTYQNGLGEFFFVNKLNPRTLIEFPVTHGGVLSTYDVTSDGLLVGIGGGKDSLVSVELLKNSGLDIATWSLNHRPQLTPLVERIGLPHFWVEREWDKQLLNLNAQGAYNGHVPISAIIACVGTVVAILTGRRDHVVSNEQSANEPTLTYDGEQINHQYSKSQAFEEEYQTLSRARFGDSLRYYSLLRPLSELRIAEIFSKSGFDTYHDVFSSCNRAFTHSSDHMFWDGTCPKCAFVFLALTPFVPVEKLLGLFGGKNLLLDPELELTYRQLLGIEGDKPLECVGEIKESRAAMREAQKLYPELVKYQFDLPEDYDFRKLASHHIPDEIWKLIAPQLAANH